MIYQYLHEGWTVHAVGDLPDDFPAALRNQIIPAAVPGCVHTDLMAAGVLDDPYYDQNELKQKWIGWTDWSYRTTFTVPDGARRHEHIALCFEGLDTVATVMLNGERLGTTENMHMAYRFEIKPLLRPGENELIVTFASPNRYAYDWEAKLGALPYLNTEVPFNFIRKMACNFGWDWGPALVTSGIWLPVSLQAWDGGRFDGVRPLVTEATPDRAALEVHVDLVRSTAEPLRVAAALTDPDGEVVAEASAVAGDALLLPLVVDEPLLWWPRGYGDQPLYTLTLTLYSGAAPLDRWEGRVGLRQTRLLTPADEIGSAFVIEINGQAIWCKGANWIPDDCFLNRVDEARYRQRITQATDAHMNMLRVWGGGFYENQTFYDICDELGVMVWQDFPFACAAYPESGPFPALVEAEARHQVTRLSRHPSLVIWNGCNENIWGYFEWGWQEKLGDRAWGAGYYLDILPRVVAELDPSRPYWPGSPYSGSMDLPPNANEHGNRHVWDAWFGGNYTVYRGHRPRFSSEFGFQAPAGWATLSEAMPAAELTPGSGGLAHRQKSPGSNERLEVHMREFFNAEGVDFLDWLYLLQVNQMRALTLGVEWFRSLQPVCMGTLYWQLNDCWPALSWSSVDSNARLKPMWYATRRFYASRLLTIQPDGDELWLCALNDSPDFWSGEVSLRRITFDGDVLAVSVAHFDAPARANGRAHIGPALATPIDPARELLLAEGAGLRALWFFDVDKNLAYDPPQFEAQVAPHAEGVTLTITAMVLLRDIVLMVDLLDPDATVDEQGITLLPGDTHTFTIITGRALTSDQLTKPPVFMCANHFGRGRMAEGQ